MSTGQVAVEFGGDILDPLEQRYSIKIQSSPV